LRETISGANETQYNQPMVSSNPRPLPEPSAHTGTNPAVNYFGLVRPQIDFRDSLLQLQQQSAPTMATWALASALAASRR
jgi:hypothetical protein